MKRFKDILSEAAVVVNKPLQDDKDDTGVTHNTMGAYELNHMEKFAEQISGAFQQSIKTLLEKIEGELNKFGFTLGELDDLSDDGESEDSEDLVVYEKYNGEMVKNMYITLEWVKLASGQSYDHRPDGAKLMLSVEMTINKVTPEEFENLYSGAENADGIDQD